jgi:nickel-dependent lactate racemase
MEQSVIQLPYGDNNLRLAVPDRNLLGVITPKSIGVSSSPPSSVNLPDEDRIIRQALAHPIGAPRLREIVRSGQRVAIVTSDVTRPCPSAKLIPYVLEELDAAGVSIPDDVFIVIALGLHRRMTSQEIDQAIPPEARQHVPVLNHDIANTIHRGVTSRGTPAEFFRPVVEANVRVCLGNLEFHWFAGYSGGAKAILPGCASTAAIYANHGLMVHPGVGSGRTQGNPIREDMEEAVAQLGIVFILNVVVDREHRIIGAVAGDWIAAHRQGCEMVNQRGKVAVSRKADIVIASAGGYPKDINLYQAHKGMEHASYFLRDDGVLVFLAECREGMGNKVFESWMLSASSPAEILDRVRREFTIGGHKAAGIARIQQRVHIHLISNLPDDLVHRLFMIPFKDPQDALQSALSQLSQESQVLVLPQSGSIIPDYK